MDLAEEEIVVENGSKMRLDELRSFCQNREENFYDDVVSLKSLKMDQEQPGRLIVQRGKNEPQESYGMMSHIYNQAPGVLYGLPGSYLRSLVEGKGADPELAARNFNHWVDQNKDREVLLRFKCGSETTVRAMLSANWNPVPYADVLDGLSVKFGGDQTVNVERFSDTILVFNIVTGKLERKSAKKGDVVEWGMRYRDSDVGIGRLEMLPYTLTLWCTNGATMSNDGIAMHLSHSSKATSDMHSVLSNVRQGVEMIAGYGRSVVDLMDRAESVVLEEQGLKSLFERIDKKFTVTKLEGRHAREGWEAEAANRPEPTVLRLSNAYTRAANSQELKPDSRFKLQAVGGGVLDLLNTRWRWD